MTGEATKGRSPSEVRAVSRILADLTDRRGLRQAWEDIDDDIQEEIIETWEDIIRQEIAP